MAEVGFAPLVETKTQPPMLSYAQNAEDVVLERVFTDVEVGFYVDVGASAPVDDSVTNHFYERGWHGVNIEPDPDDYRRLVESRTRDVNLQLAVGSGSDPLTFHQSEMRGHGTLDAELAKNRGETATIQVPQVSLDDVFSDHAPSGGIQFLKVDVEGWEADVLSSAKWDRWRPQIVVVEAVDDHGEPTQNAWEAGLLEVDYVFGLFDGVNRFYCRKEDADVLLLRLAAPANVFDNWRSAREVALQDQLLKQLDAVNAGLQRETEAHRVARRDLATSRDALEAERRAHDATRRAHDATRLALVDVYASTSWRITAPIRDTSRLVRLMRRGGADA
jgi:FkbM family methyltransferase